MQFQSFLEDPQYKDQHELQTTMIRTFGKVAPHAEPHFRDEGIAINVLRCFRVFENEYILLPVLEFPSDLK